MPFPLLRALATARPLLAPSSPLTKRAVFFPVSRYGVSPSVNAPAFSRNKRSMVTHAAGSGPPDPAAPFETVDVKEAAARLQAGIPLLDVRTPEEFSGGHPPGAQNANVQGDGFLAAATALFPEKDAPLLVSCLRGGRSAAAAAQLTAAGYTNITNVAGGYSAWTEAGLEVE